MAGPRQRRPPEQAERRRPDVTVPRLSEAEMRRRAESGFDRTVAAILRPQLAQVRSDITTLRNQMLADQRRLPADASESARNAALEASVDRFLEEHPDSPLSRYISAGNTEYIADFSFSWRGNRATINLRLDAAPVERWLQSPFAQVRSGAVSRILEACEPVPATESRDIYFTMRGMSRENAQALVSGLARELNIGPDRSVPRGHLPITIAYTTNAPDAVGTPAFLAQYAGVRPPGRIRG